VLSNVLIPVWKFPIRHSDASSCVLEPTSWSSCAYFSLFGSVLFTRFHISSAFKQENWAIAKMAALCALYYGDLKIFESPWVLPRLLFPKFLMGFRSDRSYEYEHLGKRRAYGVGVVSFERALVSSHRPSIVTVPLPLHVSEILPLLCFGTPLFLIPPLVSPKFPYVPLGVRWMAFGLRRAKVIG